VVFDVLHLDGLAVRRLPYRRRREHLADLQLQHPTVLVPEPLDATPEQALAVVAEHHLEGIVAKRWDGAYPEGQRRWIKH
jgi:bifunctional non-homologous end joining protein LigD